MPSSRLYKFIMKVTALKSINLLFKVTPYALAEGDWVLAISSPPASLPSTGGREEIAKESCPSCKSCLLYKD